MGVMIKKSKFSTFLLLAGAMSLPLMFSSCAWKKDKDEDETPEVKKQEKKTSGSGYTRHNYSHKVNPSVSLSAGSARGVSHYGGSPALPYIALTFDDGPHPTLTPRLLDILKSHNVKATFYVTGQNVARYPGITRRIVAEGHEIGNHTWGHPNLTKLSDAAVRSELDRTNTAIVNAVGVKPRTFRPPYAAMTSRQRAWVNAEYGYPIVFWNVDPRDWKDRNANLVTSRLLSGTRKGSILLLHDIHATSVSAVPQTINGLISKGYQFVTVSQLLSTK